MKMIKFHNLKIFRVLLTQESVTCHLAVLDVVKLVVKAAHEHLEFVSTQTEGEVSDEFNVCAVLGSE